MTEAMIAQAVQTAGATVQTTVPQTVQPVADPQAVELFREAMGVESAGGVPFVSQVAETWSAVQDNHQGLLHRIRALTEMRAVHGASMVQMSELQYEVATLVFQQEVVTSVAKKASDAVSTLVRNG